MLALGIFAWAANPPKPVPVTGYSSVGVTRLSRHIPAGSSLPLVRLCDRTRESRSFFEAAEVFEPFCRGRARNPTLQVGVSEVSRTRDHHRSHLAS
jgi:hypothetical protein